MSEELEPVEKKLRQALKDGLIDSDYLGYQIDEGLDAGIIDKQEAATLREFHGKVSALMAVDDFDPEELVRNAGKDAATADDAGADKSPVRKKAAARKRSPSRKKTASSKEPD